MPRRRPASRGNVKPFDATTKFLVERDPNAWLAYAGLRATGPVTIIDSDVSTIAADVDKVVRVDHPTPWLVHLELQASHDATMAARLLLYHALLYRRHGLPLQNVVVLLRREADRPELTGRLQQRLPDRQLVLDFHYRVVRVWQQPVDAVLAGGLATLPLAPLCDDAAADLPGVIRQIDERVRREAKPSEIPQFWLATYLLLGLRYSDDVAEQLLRGVRAMKESSTYQAILAEGRAEGRAEEARRILLDLGSVRFGPPDRLTRVALERIDDPERLESLIRRVHDVASWADLTIAER